MWLFLLRRCLLSAPMLLALSGQQLVAQNEPATGPSGPNPALPTPEDVRRLFEELLTASDSGRREAYEQFRTLYVLLYEQGILEAGSNEPKIAMAVIPELERWIAENAEGGSATAQYWMGARGKILQGYGAKSPDLADVAKWYRASAEQGFGPAQDALGQILGFFPEFARESFEAEKWLFRAVRQGEPAADQRLLLAIRLDSDRADYQPDADILAWLRQRADGGDAEAQSLVDKFALQD
jgi:TPR repeat protein